MLPFTGLVPHPTHAPPAYTRIRALAHTLPRHAPPPCMTQHPFTHTGHRPLPSMAQYMPTRRPLTDIETPAGRDVLLFRGLLPGHSLYMQQQHTQPVHLPRRAPSPSPPPPQQAPRQDPARAGAFTFSHMLGLLPSHPYPQPFPQLPPGHPTRPTPRPRTCHPHIPGRTWTLTNIAGAAQQVSPLTGIHLLRFVLQGTPPPRLGAGAPVPRRDHPDPSQKQPPNPCAAYPRRLPGVFPA